MAKRSIPWPTYSLLDAKICCEQQRSISIDSDLSQPDTSTFRKPFTLFTQSLFGALNVSLLASKMCWQRYKTVARWPDCAGGVGPCSTHDPDRDYVQWCPQAEESDTQCEPLTQTSQASSTRRKTNCPNHRNQAKPPPRDNGKGAGGTGGSGSMTATSPGVTSRVG